jgi:hypothetical protein
MEQAQSEWHAYVRRLKAALAGSDLEFFKKPKGRTATERGHEDAPGPAKSAGTVH